jgi:hypothetical protein
LPEPDQEDDYQQQGEWSHVKGVCPVNDRVRLF